MEATTTYTQEPSSLLGLIAGLREDVRNLFREEAKLIKTELSEKFALVSRNSVYLAIGGAIAFVALSFLLCALSFIIAVGFQSLGLNMGIALFLGFLSIAVVTGSIGGILIGKALSAFRKNSLVPDKTLQTLREIKEGGIEQLPVKTYQPQPQPKDTRNSDQIRSDVEATRSRIGREVRSIRTRLAVAHLANSMVWQMKRNPVRSVGIGLGTGVAGFIVMRVARLFGRKRLA